MTDIAAQTHIREACEDATEAIKSALIIGMWADSRLEELERQQKAIRKATILFAVSGFSLGIAVGLCLAGVLR